MKKSIAIIGGGPAGLMAADIISQSDVKVDVYEVMPSIGRKLLMAGKTGLNITHSEPYEMFVTRYGEKQKEITKYLNHFTPNDIVTWAKKLNVETFIGTSGRIFPKEMKASPLLRAWLEQLKLRGVTFHLRHHWKGWQQDALIFETPKGIIANKANATILALGGASWPKLGSRGDWIPWLENRGVCIRPFQPANCGFIVKWTQHFIEKFHGQPIKSVILSFNNFKQQGEFVVTKKGIEGSLIYSASDQLRNEILSNGHAFITLDLIPHLSEENLIKALSKPRGSRSRSNHIKKTTGLEGVKLGLLYEFLSMEDFLDIEKLAETIKSLRIPLLAPSSLATAISSAGGIPFEELDDNLMLHKIAGVFCAGEMLDWEAPTGGYLLTACLATGKAAGQGALNWLQLPNATA